MWSLQLIEQKMNRNSEKYSKLQWTQQQQSYLKELKQVQILKSWKFIAGMVNEKFPDKNRNGKQCRQRYMNYVRFNQQRPKILGWSQQDDHILFDKFLEFGARWVQISNHMPGRSQNCLKNRFYGALRRVIRKINKIEKEKKLKYKKSIKYDSLMRILSYKTLNEETQQTFDQAQKSQFFQQLRKDLIKLAISQQEYVPTGEVLSLIVRIHQFNCRGRGVSLKKVKSMSTIQESLIVSLPKCESNSPVTEKANQNSLIAQKLDEQSQCIHSWLEQPEQSNSIISILNEQNIKYKQFRNLEEQLCQILNQNYAPENLPYF